MTLTAIAAVAYAVLSLAPITAQLALTAGAPIGHLTLGGKWPGRLPSRLRLVTLLQAVILGTMAVTVLAVGGVLDLPSLHWLFWPAFVMTVLTLISNSITPSAPERRLWAPIIALMFLAICVVAFG